MLLDEVFDGLDKSGQRAVRGVLEKLSQQVKKVFVVTHTDFTAGRLQNTSIITRPRNENCWRHRISYEKEPYWIAIGYRGYIQTGVKRNTRYSPPR
jgi:ABC-type transport system involved in cytochrome bd biosynthesis fused ATPase/permease subunit